MYTYLCSGISKSMLPSQIVDECYYIHLRGAGEKLYHLFTVQKSTVGNGQWGLFAGSNFQEGRCIGLYHGNLFSPQPGTKEPSEYAMASDSLRIILDPGKGIGSQLFFGIHFANDANYGKSQNELLAVPAAAGTRSRSAKKSRNNITICGNFWVYTTRKVRKGEELFLDYNRNDVTVTTKVLKPTK